MMAKFFGGPLEDRQNPSNWAWLLDMALPALDHAMPDERERWAAGKIPRWTLGGGTALALRFGHRASDDIDIFLSGIRLAELTPGRNPPARAISERFQWPGSYLKYEHPLGEVDFLSSALQTSPGFTVEVFRGRTIALETPEEVLTKKLRYRGAKFTERDAFDLACVLKARPEVALVLAIEAGDAVPRARLALQARNSDATRSKIREAGSDFFDISANINAEAIRCLDEIGRLRDDPITPEGQREIDTIVVGLDVIKPSDTPGLISYGWTTKERGGVEPLISKLKARPTETKAALVEEWRRRDPTSLALWDARGRQPEPTPTRPEDGRTARTEPDTRVVDGRSPHFRSEGYDTASA